MSAISDRELIELAAAAAGIEHAIIYDAAPEDGFPTAYARIGKRKYWNPLADDGDAFRLMVLLIPCITQWPTYLSSAPHVMVGYSTGPESGSNWIEDYGTDPYAATRRAIVSAAAQIELARRAT